MTMIYKKEEKQNIHTNVKDDTVKFRNSNFELLRLLSMFLIIISHYSLHGGFDAPTYNTLSINKYFLQILLHGGKIGCYLFMFITGYFMIYRKNNYKKILKLFLELEFYSIVIFFIFNFGMGKYYSKKDWIRNLLPIVYGNWFVVNYIMMYFFIPFINKIVLCLDDKNLKKMVLLIVIIYSLIPTIGYYVPKYQWSFSNFDFMLVSYIIGAYIRIKGFSKFEDKKKCIKIILISVCILLLLILVMDLLATKFKNNTYIWMATITRYQTAFGELLISIAIFYLFKNISFKSRFINFIAPSMLGIYLIHDNDLVRPWLWKEVFPNNNYLYTNYLVVHFFVKVVAVFIICLIIDLIRRYMIEKPCQKLIDWTYEKSKSAVKKIWQGLDRFFA